MSSRATRPGFILTMKIIKIEIRIPGGSKMATGIKTQGYSDNNVSDQLELLGIMENLKMIIQERIKQLTNVRS